MRLAMKRIDLIDERLIARLFEAGFFVQRSVAMADVLLFVAQSLNSSIWFTFAVIHQSFLHQVQASSASPNNKGNLH